MAKIDDIKSQQPDSRLTSLGTTFRPGQKRIALPTSKQMSSHAGEVREHSVKAENATISIEERTPSSSIHFSEITEPLLRRTELGTTQHNNSAQLDTVTQHNSTQILDNKNTTSIITNETIKDSIIYPAQPDTDCKILITHRILDEPINKNLHLDSIIKGHPNFTSDGPFDILRTESKLCLENPAQPDTDTRHKINEQPGTTQHNLTQNRKNKQNSEVEPGTTRHNPTPGPAQLNTLTRHKNDNEPDFNDFQKRINNLSGTSALVLSFLCKKCIDTGTNRVTISYRILSELIRVNFNSIPTTCKRLRNTGFFELSGSKGGAQAVRHFDLSDFTIRAFTTELMKPKFPTVVNEFPGTTRHNNPAQPDTWADTSASSMYVGINKNTIHTDYEQNCEKQENAYDPWSELRDLDFSSADQFMIKSTVIDTFKKNKWVITRNQLEEHLERFVRYFSEKEFEKRREPIKSPYSFFLSSIKAISKGEPDPICDVETQFEIIQKQAVQNKLKALEVRRREFEANEKQMDQYRDSEFEHWVQGLADEEKVQFALPSKMAELGSGRHKLLLKDYFTQNIWPEIKQNVLMAPRS